MDQHEYQRDPQSGAGNCVCGARQQHRRHPHDFVRAHAMAATATILRVGSIHVCVCGLAADAPQHLASLETQNGDPK